MSLKIQIRLGVLLMLGLLLGLGSYVIFTIHRLESEAPAVQAANARLAQQAVYLFLLISTLLGIVLTVRLPRLVMQPLRRLTADVERVAGPGPATRVAVPRHSEVGTIAAAVNRVLTQAEDERRITLAELFTQRNRLDSLVESLDEGLLLLDERGIIVLANDTAINLLGLEELAPVGRPAAEVAALAAASVNKNMAMSDLLATLAAANLAGDATPDPVFTFPHRGSEPHYQLSISPIKVADLKTDEQPPAGHILCLRNVSEFKKLDQMKSDFLATVSHELKTPLSSINLSLMLLRDERTAPEERQRLAAGIGEETQRLLRLVGQLLAVSRLDAGAGIQLNRQSLKPDEFIRFATATVLPQLTDKHLQLDMQLPDSLPAVFADAEKTSWVLINLLANAIRYSPLGAPLRIRALPWGEMVQISVEDQGPGIAREHHQRIFQRFEGVPQAGGSTGGTGLGLSISREFIKAQGGELWVESQPDRRPGSCFVFTLPAAQ